MSRGVCYDGKRHYPVLTTDQTEKSLMIARSDGLYARLRQFTFGWRRQTSSARLTSRLESFFAQAEGLRTPAARVRTPISPKISCDQIGALVAALSPSLHALRSRGALPNPWRAAGLKWDEVRNTAALALLWDERRSGQPAAEFLGEFLRRVLPETDALQISEMLKEGYKVRVEDSPIGLSSERVDLTIESASMLVGIEVKIHAGLGKEQLQRYVDTVRRRAASPERNYRVILLAPFPSPMSEVLSASWRDVIFASRAILPRSTDRTFTHHLIAHFAEHISSWKVRHGKR